MWPWDAVMPITGHIRTLRLILPAIAAGALLCVTAALARADIVSLSDQLRGTIVSQPQCEELPRAVWLNVAGRDFCMRYYLSMAGGPGSRAFVFLQGDRLGRLNGATGEFSPGPRDKDVDTSDYNRVATTLSQQSGMPGIYLARPGLDGSSGSHRIRHSTLELHVVNAALDAIKRRHKLEGFHMIGQSGGSTLIGGLLGLRSDLGCAVIGAGVLSYPRTLRSTDPARDYFNATEAVGVIAQNRATRIMLVTDPSDRKVPERVQTEFVTRLRLAGGRAEQFLVQALDEDRHGVLAYTRTAALGCLRGASTEEIGKRLAQQVEKALAAKTAAEAQKLAATRDGGFSIPTQ
jgi:hypothetical protein